MDSFDRQLNILSYLLFQLNILSNFQVEHTPLSIPTLLTRTMGDRRALTSSDTESEHDCRQHCQERDELRQKLSEIRRKGNVRTKRARDKRKLEKEERQARLARRQAALDRLAFAAAGHPNPRNIM